MVDLRPCHISSKLLNFQLEVRAWRAPRLLVAVYWIVGQEGEGGGVGGVVGAGADKGISRR